MRRPAIVAVSAKSCNSSLLLSAYFSFNCPEFAVRSKRFPKGSIPCSASAAIFSRRIICWSFNSSKYSVVMFSSKSIPIYFITKSMEIHLYLAFKKEKTANLKIHSIKIFKMVGIVPIYERKLLKISCFEDSDTSITEATIFSYTANIIAKKSPN